MNYQSDTTELEKIKAMNDEIITSNNLTDETLNRTRENINKMDVNFDKMKTYLNEQKIKMKNPYVQRQILKIENEINNLQQGLLKLSSLIKEEQEKPKNKLYETLYEEPKE